MAGQPKTKAEIVANLLANAIPNGTCLECHLATSTDRHGHERHYVMVGGRGGQRVRATRLVYGIIKGEIANLWVLHSCDNAKCINPDHLFLGTAQDNTNDMISKGRKIDDPTVGPRRRMRTATKIYNLLWEGYNDQQICDKLHISKSTLWNYRRGPYSSTLSSGD